jgi:hypothetical protein
MVYPAEGYVFGAQQKAIKEKGSVVFEFMSIYGQFWLYTPSLRATIIVAIHCANGSTASLLENK